ncbi:MAG TPA: MoaD/ThiS family protein [Quisquiliibacterium sp.]|nr:MoaD/ThiS family protein [Quisquiliibacterium sp.]HPA88605.1 MoaD/ThiS family protein [Quisquiliibacterium sp.]HQD84622.1 MoaD/ThiS family protein [Quisquiliibacterium sp.]HQN11882.1 MoaD/ThiS family protein [Quisquiliibacterium sp.]HQP66017.1 MoaD/ThiS family protein [Quisquiliibacterium sp.]
MARLLSAVDEVRAFTGTADVIDVQARTVGGLIAELERRFPGLGAHVQQRMAIAIDGEIHQDALAEPIGPDSEVVLIPRIGGG